MFGKRGGNSGGTGFGGAPRGPVDPSPVAAAPEVPAPMAASPAVPAQRVAQAPAIDTPQRPVRERDEDYYDTKSSVFSALIDTIDLGQLAKMDTEAAREEIRDIVNDIISLKNLAMSISEQEDLLEDICNDVLGYGPLEPLLARDDIADIMINGARNSFIEVNGKVMQAGVRFRDNAQLMNICQRIVSQV
ncbi:MAG: CpaF family protein, partial [Nitratireductor sp.]|nr:CpaF family protein [Nitratireductor sp.]